MSLPFGPIVRGFTPQWCYERIEGVVSQLKNIYGIKPLQGREKFFIGREQLDPRVAETSSSPAMIITLAPGATTGNSNISGIPQIVYEPGEIVHLGTGTDQVSLTGKHHGNNKFALEITASGTVGTDGSYELRRTPWDGDADTWGTEVVVSSGAIPASGEIEVENGQTLAFTVGQSVVDDDTYSWETEAYKISNVLGRTIVQRARVDIYFFNPNEITWEDNNPLDQLVLMFNKRIHDIEILPDHVVRVEEELTGYRPHWESLPGEEENARQVFVVSVELKYQGQNRGSEPVAFTARISPLITQQDMGADTDHTI